MKKNHHLHRLVRLCLIISLLLLCSTSQVFAAAKVNLKNTKIKLLLFFIIAYYSYIVQAFSAHFLWKYMQKTADNIPRFFFIFQQ